MEPRETIEHHVDPSSIEFTQAGITEAFRDGKLVSDTIFDLLDGNISTSDIPLIRVVRWKSRMYSLDNRRLYVFREVGQPISVRVVEKSYEFYQKLDPRATFASVALSQSTSSPRHEVEVRSRSAVRSYKDDRSVDKLNEKVCKWSLEDIHNPHMFSNRLPDQIPLTFTRAEHYFPTFEWFVWEELRAGVEGALAARKRRSPILVYLEKLHMKPEHDRRLIKSPSFGAFEFSLPAGLTKAREKELREQLRPNVLVIFTRMNIDRDRIGYDTLTSKDLRNEYTLGMLGYTDEDSYIFRVDLFEHAAFQEAHAQAQDAAKHRRGCGCEWYLTPLTTLSTAQRVMARINNQPRSSVLGEILSGRPPPNSGDLASMFDGSMSTFGGYREFGAPPRLPQRVTPLYDESAVEVYCNKSGLNESQCAAVMNAATRSEGVSAIQGPPGTGKTTTLVRIISVLLSRGSVLVTAPTNVAIAEVALRTAQLIRDSKCFAPASPSLRPMRVADLVLIALKEKVDLDGPLKELHLDTRVIAISKCARALQTLLMETSQLLLNPSEVFRKQKVATGEKVDTDSKRRKEFVKWLKEGMKRNYESFCRDLETLVPMLPSKHLGEMDSAGQSLLPCSKSLCDFVSSLEPRNFTVESFKVSAEGESGSSLAHEAVKKTMYRFVLEDDLQEVLMQGRQKYRVSALSFAKELRRVSRSHDALKEMLLSSARAIFCTVTTAGRGSLGQYLSRINVAIVDEAAQLPESTSLILLRSNLRKLVLCGDPRQLPATMLSRACVELDANRSLFERLEACGHPGIVMLDTQYRMHPHISHFPSTAFYESKLLDGANVTAAERVATPRITLTHARSKRPLPATRLFVDVDSIEEASKTQSWLNLLEQDVVVGILKLHAAAKLSLSVGVISPYSAQVENLDRVAKALKLPFDVEVATVDGFQGREKDVIILSTVRANARGAVGFLNDRRRMNVAITRARHSLFVVGNARTLENDDMWQRFIRDAQAHDCMVPYAEVVELTGAVKKTRSTDMMIGRLLSTGSLEHVFEESPWILDVSKALRDALDTMSKERRRPVFNALAMIADGHRGQYAAASEKFKGVIFAKKLSDKRHLVYSVDVHHRDHRQYLLVWDVCEHTVLKRLVERIERFMQNRSPEYVACCKEALFADAKRKKRVVPRVFQLGEDFIWTVEHEERRRGGSGEDEGEDAAGDAAKEGGEIDEALALTKFFRMTSHFARDLLSHESSGIERPFVLSPEEEAIAETEGSVFILGRSGTGKTTLCVLRMYRLEKAYAEKSVGADDAKLLTFRGKATHLRQMMITASPHLCLELTRYYARLRRSIERADDLESEFQGDAREEKKDDGDNEISNSLDAYEDLQEAFASIPDNTTLLSDDHFPMFLTYQKLLDMIDGSLEVPFRCHILHEGASEDSIALLKRFHAHEVTFQRFESEYWPRLNAKLKKGTDAARLWSEISTSLKGSVDALTLPISRKDYISCSEKKSFMFPMSKRNDVFSLFEQYESLKREARDWDVGDQVRYVHQYLDPVSARKYLGATVSTLTVDEVQDLTPAQLSLFRFLCRNPYGYVFAGDTAQTIARGSQFRFEDLLHLFHDVYRFDNEKLRPKDGFTATSSSRKFYCPKLQQLTRNFRTHSGVLNLANAIVDMVVRYFPRSIDKLKPETARVVGREPKFLRSKSDENTVSLFGSSKQHGNIEFGAEQVILVRNALQKQEIRKRIDALVLTITEAKGLEFRDVLVWNFWTGSEMAPQRWRVIYEFLSEIKGELASGGIQEFDSSKHGQLCSELKMLYVAVTRARQQLWFFDEERSEASAPMRAYFEHTGVICYGDVAEMADLAKCSTPEEWNRQGDKLFRSQKFEAAKICFQKANNREFVDICEANLIKIDATKATGTKATGLWRNAADIFLKHDQSKYAKNWKTEAAKCLERAGDKSDKRKAARIREELGDPLGAAENYAAANEWDQAVKLFVSCRHISRAFECCVAGNRFDLAETVVLPASSSDEEASMKYLNEAIPLIEGRCEDEVTIRRFYAYIPEKFSSDKLSLLRRYKHWDELMQAVLRGADGHVRAAGLFLEWSAYDEAAREFGAAGDHTKAVACALKHLRCLMWNNHEHRIEFVESDQTYRAALEKCSHFIDFLEHGDIRQRFQAEIEFYKMILDPWELCDMLDLYMHAETVNATRVRLEIALELVDSFAKSDPIATFCGADGHQNTAQMVSVVEWLTEISDSVSECSRKGSLLPNRPAIESFFELNTRRSGIDCIVEASGRGDLFRYYFDQKFAPQGPEHFSRTRRKMKANVFLREASLFFSNVVKDTFSRVTGAGETALRSVTPCHSFGVERLKSHVKHYRRAVEQMRKDARSQHAETQDARNHQQSRGTPSNAWSKPLQHAQHHPPSHIQQPQSKPFTLDDIGEAKLPTKCPNGKQCQYTHTVEAAQRRIETCQRHALASYLAQLYPMYLSLESWGKKDTARDRILNRYYDLQVRIADMAFPQLEADADEAAEVCRFREDPVIRSELCEYVGYLLNVLRWEQNGDPQELVVMIASMSCALSSFEHWSSFKEFVGIQREIQDCDKRVFDLEHRLEFLNDQLKKCKDIKYKKKFNIQLKKSERDLAVARKKRAELPWSIPRLSVQLCCNFLTGKIATDECVANIAPTTHPLMWRLHALETFWAMFNESELPPPGVFIPLLERVAWPLIFVSDGCFFNIGPRETILETFMSDTAVFESMASGARDRFMPPELTQRCLDALGNFLFSVICRFGRWSSYIYSFENTRVTEKVESFRRLLRLLLVFVVNRSSYTDVGRVHPLVARLADEIYRCQKQFVDSSLVLGLPRSMLRLFVTPFAAPWMLQNCLQALAPERLVSLVFRDEDLPRRWFGFIESVKFADVSPDGSVTLLPTLRGLSNVDQHRGQANATMPLEGDIDDSQRSSKNAVAETHLDADLTEESSSNKSKGGKAGGKKSAAVAPIAKAKPAQYSDDAIARLTASANTEAATRIETQRDKLSSIADTRKGKSALSELERLEAEIRHGLLLVARPSSSAADSSKDDDEVACLSADFFELLSTDVVEFLARVRIVHALVDDIANDIEHKKQKDADRLLQMLDRCFDALDFEALVCADETECRESLDKCKDMLMNVVRQAGLRLQHELDKARAAPQLACTPDDEKDSSSTNAKKSSSNGRQKKKNANGKRRRKNKKK